MTDLTKLIELQDAATPDWYYFASDDFGGPRIHFGRKQGGIQLHKNTPNADINAQLMAAARNFDFRALDEKIKEIESKNKHLRNELLRDYAPQGMVTTFMGESVEYWLGVDEKIKRYEEALRTIAEYGDEENEWDAVDKYKDVRGVARKALEQ